MFDILLRAGSFISIIVLGYFLKRIGFFKDEDFSILSKITIRITLPCAIITSFASKTIDPIIGSILSGNRLWSSVCIDRLSDQSKKQQGAAVF